MCARTVCPAALVLWEAGCRYHSRRKGGSKAALAGVFWCILGKSAEEQRDMTWSEGCWFLRKDVVLVRWGFFIFKIFLLRHMFFLLLPLVRAKLEENILFYACSHKEKQTTSNVFGMKIQLQQESNKLYCEKMQETGTW